MKLTFILISYNEKEYLEHAINSCLSQELEDFEIIIGDDGSSDGSIEVIEAYAKKYPKNIRYFVSDRTGVTGKTVIASLRVSAVIQRALQMALGEYCVVLSGDDYFYKSSFFKNAIKFLDNNPDYVTYVGGYEKVWEDRPSIEYHITYPRKIYWARKYVHLSTFVFRKSVYDQGTFLQRFCDDTGLQYSLAFSGKWKIEPTVMFAYRQRSGSIMHKIDMLENHIVEMMIFQDVLCKGELYRESLAKFSYSLKLVFKQRSELCNEKYRKYLDNCKNYEHNILQRVAEFDNKSKIEQTKFKLWMLGARCLWFYYRILGYSYTVIRKSLVLLKR